MPRVSEEHLAARRRQILDAARVCFSRNGFHSTSMQDILRESGLSAGAVYRYFPGKEAIIAAIAGEAIGALAAAIEDGDDDLPLRELIERALHAVDERARTDDVGRLALQVWAEAARNKQLRTHIAKAVKRARSVMQARIARAHPEVDAAAAAAVAVALVPGYLHAKVIVGDMDAERYLAGFDALVAAAR